MRLPAPLLCMCPSGRFFIWVIFFNMCDENKEIRDVKQPTSFEEQLNKIEKRGCIIGDNIWAKEVLKQIN